LSVRSTAQRKPLSGNKAKARTKKKSPCRGAADAALHDAGRYLMNTYRRPPLVFVRGSGCYLYDQHGRKYLDFLSGIGVNALGCAHPRLVRMLRRQAAAPLHVSNLYHHLYQGPLARRLAAWSGMDRVFFCNSGTEAVEGASSWHALRRINAGPRRRRASWPWKIRFTAAPSGRLP
jgi:acetylornithine/succinyldiaminopimelate/putrescine aminotransferase